ncbi:MAG: HEAT repeat domain-containing protein [Bdellovibrionota bacterium]
MLFAFLLTAIILIYNRYYDRFYAREYKRLVSDTVEYMLDEELPPPFADVLRRRILRNVIIDMLFITKGQSLETLQKVYHLNGYYKHDLALLRHHSWHKRLAAIVRIDQWKSSDSLIEYSYLLDDNNKDVRIHAMKTLSRTLDPELAENILNHLASTRVDLFIRYECLSRLLHSHRDLLIKSLKNPEASSLAPLIITVLGDKRDIASVPFILDACHSESVTLRESGYTALGKIGDPRSVSFLLEGINSDEPNERVAAIKALALVDEELLLKHREYLESDQDPLVQGWARHILRKINA